MSVNPVFHARTKHVEIDFHFVQDRVADKSLVVRFVPSSDQLADVLTKPLVSAKFQQLCFKLNVRSPPLTLREGIRTRLAQDSKSSRSLVRLNLWRCPTRTLLRSLLLLSKSRVML